LYPTNLRVDMPACCSIGKIVYKRQQATAGAECELVPEAAFPSRCVDWTGTRSEYQSVEGNCLRETACNSTSRVRPAAVSSRQEDPLRTKNQQTRRGDQQIHDGHLAR